MRNIILYSLFFLITGHISIANAAPISRANISKLIKNEILTRNNTTDSEFAGFMTSNASKGAYCKERIVDNINILRIGEIHRNWFKVKFRIKGSCKLSRPVKVDIRSWSDIYSETNSGPSRVTKLIDGRVPYRNIPLEINIKKDGYGDWIADSSGAYNITFFNRERDEASSKSSQAYREKLYLKLGKGLQQIYDGEITTLQSRRRGGALLQTKSKTHTKLRAKNTKITFTFNNRLSRMVAPWNWETAAFYEMEEYFKKHLDIYKVFDSLPLNKQYQLVQRVAESKNHQHYMGKTLKNPGTQHRYQIILQISKELKHSKRK